MSMMGEFVQVTPSLLAQLQADPDRITELLQSPEGPGPQPKNLSPDFQKRIAPILAATMRRYDPSVQEQLAKRLGMDAEAMRRGEVGGDFLQKLFSMPGAARDSQPLEGRGDSLSIDKAWHGVHYLLCGEAKPGSSLLSQAVLGGTELGDDLGYGPARYFDAARTAEISRALNRESLEQEMIARFDPARMSELQIYPSGWNAAGLNWLLEEYRKLSAFYADAVSNNQAIIAWLA